MNCVPLMTSSTGCLGYIQNVPTPVLQLILQCESKESGYCPVQACFWLGYRTIGNCFAVSITTVCRCVQEFCTAAETLLVPEHICVPSEEKFREMSTLTKCGLPNCANSECSTTNSVEYEWLLKMLSAG